MRRYEVWWAKLPNVGGSIYKGIRPVLIVQNDVGNTYSSTVIVVPLTSKKKKLEMPTHVPCFLRIGESVIACEHIYTVPKDILFEKADIVKSKQTQDAIEKALLVSLGIKDD